MESLSAMCGIKRTPPLYFKHTIDPVQQSYVHSPFDALAHRASRGGLRLCVGELRRIVNPVASQHDAYCQVSSRRISFTPPGSQEHRESARLLRVPAFSKLDRIERDHFEKCGCRFRTGTENCKGIGNGGLAGSISFAPMAAALRSGYATASTDTGHTTQEPKTWLENRDRLIDYSYRGLHLTTENAKKIIDA